MFDMQPLRGPEAWHSDIDLKVLPPKNILRSAGRPRRNRRQTPEEPKSHGKRSRRGAIMHCSICGQEGHNKKGCKNDGGGIANAPPRDSAGIFVVEI